MHLGAFVLSNSKSKMNNFIHVFDGFKINELYYGDTDSLYKEKEHRDKSDRAGLNGKNLKRAKKDFRHGGVFYGLFLVLKTFVKI